MSSVGECNSVFRKAIELFQILVSALHALLDGDCGLTCLVLIELVNKTIDLDTLRNTQASRTATMKSLILHFEYNTRPINCLKRAA